MKLRFKLHTTGLVALVCLATVAISQPLAAQDVTTPEQLTLEAARLATPQLDDAANMPQNPEAFTKVSEAPTIEHAGERVFVDLRTVEPSAIPMEFLDSPRSHIQGQLDYDDFGSSSIPPVENPEQKTMESYLTEPYQAGESGSGTRAAGASVTNWSAQGYSGWIPPDTQLAVGPEYIVEAINSGFMVYTKTGTQTRAYTDFESFVNLPSTWNGFCYDPRVVFDPYSDKFLMMIMGKDNTNLKSYYWLMVSVTDDPNGGWWIWRVNASAGGTGEEEWLDYAAIGVDTWGIYVTGNYFRFTGGYQRTKLWSWGNDFMTGTSTSAYGWNDLQWPSGSNAFTMQPAMPLSTNSSGNSFYVNSHSGSGSEMCLWTQTGKRHPASSDPAAANMARVVIPSKTYYSMGNNVDQPGSDWDIDGGNTSTRNAVYGFGKVWSTLALNWDNNRVYSEVYFAVFNVGAGDMDYDRAVWGSAYHMNYPALTVEPSATGDVALTFSMTEPGNPAGFIGAASYSYDPIADATLNFSWQKRGDGTYSRWDGDFVGDGRNRWGDYSGSSWDWTCNNAWFAAEYATASNTWDTQIFARTLGAYDVCNYFHVSSPNGGESYTAGSSYTVSWERMNIPSGDEVYIHYWDGAAWNFITGPLAASSTSYSWSVPNAPTTLGKIFVGSQVPGSGTWKVSDTTDGTFTINGVPDLVPSLLSPAASYLTGGTYSIYNSVYNSGPVGAGSFPVQLRLSTNTTCTTGDTLIGSRTVPSLASLSLNSTQTSVTIPAGQAPGTYSLCQLVDPYDAVNEFDEGNNTTYESVVIIDSAIFADGFESGGTTAWDSTGP